MSGAASDCERFAYRPTSYVDAIEHWKFELLRVAKSIGPGEDWKDLRQAILTELLQSWQSVGNAESPLAYALRIAVRTKFKFLEKRDRRRQREVLVEWDCVHSASPHTIVSEDEIDLAQLLRSVLEELPEAERGVYEYIRIEQYSCSEVAAILELRPHQVGNIVRKIDQRMIKARARAKEQARKEGRSGSASRVPARTNVRPRADAGVRSSGPPLSPT